MKMRTVESEGSTSGHEEDEDDELQEKEDEKKMGNFKKRIMNIFCLYKETLCVTYKKSQEYHPDGTFSKVSQLWIYSTILRNLTIYVM